MNAVFTCAPIVSLFRHHVAEALFPQYIHASSRCLYTMMNASAAEPLADWDIFCRVVDNFGDIGVCWRLAKGLVADHGVAARLWVDDWEAFRRLCPDVSPDDERTWIEGVEVRRWHAVFAPVEPAATVVEAFGCELPESYLAAMARCAVAPCWINLEYLSAERWVDDCHRMASPHPRLPLVKHFFFPGFGQRTGGLLRETGLLEARDRFQADRPARAAFLSSLGVARTSTDARVISLFTYEQPGLAELLACWAEDDAPVVLLVPEGPVVGDVTRFFGASAAAGVAGACFARGALTAHLLPFTGHDAYDRLLWSCDVNFVRGEDSFVRAQWAGESFVWHIYRQRQDAHRVKLEAFLERYLDGADAGVAEAVAAFWRAWNGWGDVAATWRPFCAALPAIRAHARRWAERLSGARDLASALVHFSRDEVK